MDREIQVSHKTISAIVILIVIVGFITGGALFLSRDPGMLSMIVARIKVGTPIPAQAYQPDALAAVSAVTAFYTLDYNVMSAQWQSSVCQLATNDGCQIFQALYAPAIRQLVETKQIQTGCKVWPIRMAEDNGDTRIWLLNVTLDHPWQGTSPETQVYAEVVRVNGFWRFNRILFNQETSRFQTHTP